MAITLRQIIARNGGTTGSFRDQIGSCRNPDFFADRDIRSMAAWEGYRYLLRTDTDTETQTRYSDWACDIPAVNGRKTRVRYTDSRSRTRAVWSDGTTDAWGEWSDWQQTAAETEEAFDGTSCPYKTDTESQSDSKTEYSGWTCDVPAVNGRMTRHRYDYVRYRYRDIYSNGAAGAWGDWGGWTLTADTVEESYDGTSCPYQTGAEWRNDRTNGDAYCQVSEGVNTGYLIQPRAKDYYILYSNGDSAFSHSKTYEDSSYNTAVCPIKPLNKVEFFERKPMMYSSTTDYVVFKLQYPRALGVAVDYIVKKYENGVLQSTKSSSSALNNYDPKFQIAVSIPITVEITITGFRFNTEDTEYLYPTGYTLTSTPNR